MKIKLLLILMILSTLSYAGEYQKHCVQNFKHIELSKCLIEIQDKSNKILDEKIKSILYETADYSKLTKNDFKKTNNTFNTYVKQQCSILLVLPEEVADNITVQECEIQMTINRIRELEFLFSEY